MAKPVLLAGGLRKFFWGNKDLSLSEKAVLTALALVADADGVLVHYEALRSGLTLPTTLNGAAKLLAGETRKKTALRILKDLMSQGYLEKVPTRYGYELRLTPRSLKALGAVREMNEKIVSLNEVRRVTRKAGAP